MRLGLMGMTFGGYLVPIAIMGGIVFLAPVLCLGLYAISAQLEREQPAMLGQTFREAARNRLGTELIFALPMIMHRDVDAVTAVITSINAVLRNKKPMAL